MFKKIIENIRNTKKDPGVNLPWPNRIIQNLNQKINKVQLEFQAEN